MRTHQHREAQTRTWGLNGKKTKKQRQHRGEENRQPDLNTATDTSAHRPTKVTLGQTTSIGVGGTASIAAASEHPNPAEQTILRRSGNPMASLFLLRSPRRLTWCWRAGEQEDNAFCRAFILTTLSVMSTYFPLSLAARRVLCLLMGAAACEREAPTTSLRRRQAGGAAGAGGAAAWGLWMAVGNIGEGLE